MKTEASSTTTRRVYLTDSSQMRGRSQISPGPQADGHLSSTTMTDTVTLAITMVTKQDRKNEKTHTTVVAYASSQSKTATD